MHFLTHLSFDQFFEAELIMFIFGMVFFLFSVVEVYSQGLNIMGNSSSGVYGKIFGTIIFLMFALGFLQIFRYM